MDYVESLIPNVLACYGPLVRPESAVSLGSRGGLSGALLWQVQGADELLCLKGWKYRGDEALPPSDRHRWMERARRCGLEYVPRVYRTSAGDTVVQAGPYCFELMQWLPGKADFHDDPSDGRLMATMIALARLHHAWDKEFTDHGFCPAVERRWRVLDAFESRRHDGWVPVFREQDPIAPLVKRVWDVLLPRAGSTRDTLRKWRQTPVPLQVCLRDLWHDHVLFSGSAVSGMIDYGCVGVDSVAADLARLLGSMLRKQDPRWPSALELYARERGLTDAEIALAETLREATLVAAGANWLLGLYHEGKPCANRPATARRLAELADQLA